MYADRTTQLIVGIFGLIGIVALAILSIDLGRMELFGAATYPLYANFDDVSGLKTGDSVQLAGVKIGRVSAIELKNYRARVEFQMKNGVEIDNEAIAAIQTSGIIGDKYVAIEPGAGDSLKPGGTITHTQSSFILEKAIGQLINGGGGGEKGEKGAGDNEKEPGAAPSSGASGGNAPKPDENPIKVAPLLPEKHK